MATTQTQWTLRDTIVPKSDQLNYEDVATAPMTVTVTGMARGTPEQPVVVHVTDANGVPLRDFKPCKTVRRLLIAAWGDRGAGWVGQRMTLCADHEVTFGGAKVGGIRVSHVTGITEPMRILITASRSKRNTVTLLPLTGSTPVDEAKV
jgi:hypothetical protein